MGSVEGDEDQDSSQEHYSVAHALLTDHLWPLSDTLFIKAAMEIEHFKPMPEDLKLSAKSSTKSTSDHIQNTVGPILTNAFPTVRTAVGLLVMYNDSMYDRPVSCFTCNS